MLVATRSFFVVRAIKGRDKTEDFWHLHKNQYPNRARGKSKQVSSAFQLRLPKNVVIKSALRKQTGLEKLRRGRFTTTF